ncbi:putative ABC transport system ATP-binding protein [Lutispora thermophila DSM 19022]|uniref:Putative ABC transport system ATP-binding protein n=1 Tax=Lutispora thermophila DSM 19022 TaxID=1122184 RepID=A0A1M6HZX8_9FIRM|nr:putative ABC transport system ATP-binding protein [Lutispora thermophila DSM 19022]
MHLSVEKGDFITIIGSNGAGKSTLLNIISGSIPCDEGSIILNGEEITNMPEYKISRLVGRVFQDPKMGTAPSMTVLENIALAHSKNKRYGLSWGVDKKKIPDIKEALSKLGLGLENKLDVNVGLLSGGQRQAMALLMATISNPCLLMLDEHMAALDPKTCETISELTDKIVLEKKITTLMVTHNLKQAIAMGNRLIMMHRGKIILDIKGDEKKGLTPEKLMALFRDKEKSDILSDRLMLA